MSNVNKIMNVLLVLFCSVSIIALFAGCKSKESYRKEIEQKGIPYSTKSFVVEVGNKETTELFIKSGIDVNTRDDGDITALCNASGAGYNDSIELLIKNGAHVNAGCGDADTVTALDMAAGMGRSDTVNLLIKMGAKVNNGTVLTAIATRQIAIVKQLIDNGADIKSNSFVLLSIAVATRDINMVNLLIGNGADVNAAAKDGLTALRWAKVKGFTEMVELLERAGARE